MQRAAISQDDTTDDVEDDSDPSVMKMVNRSIANVLKNSSMQDDTPLTTSSFKALKQMEKEKVYRRLIIRIRYVLKFFFFFDWLQ